MNERQWEWFNLLFIVVAAVLLASLFTGCSLGRKTWGNASSPGVYNEMRA
jgi:hypothetical protein